MCNFGKRALGLLPPPSNLPKYLCIFIDSYRGEKGAGMGPCHICRAEKGEPSSAVQVPRCSSPSWPDTDYRSYFIYNSLNMLLLLQGKSGTELGGLLATFPLHF
jgi:hypothetical protein